VSQPGRFWQAVTTAAFQYPVDGRLKVNLMTCGNIDWLYPGPGAQGGSYSLVTIQYHGVTTGLFPGYFMFAAQQ
jgi:hypothetical protein